jgi:hypothetical protein
MYYANVKLNMLVASVKERREAKSLTIFNNGEGKGILRFEALPNKGGREGWRPAKEMTLRTRHFI